MYLVEQGIKTVFVNLVVAKTRAPLKQLSISWLELLGSLNLAKLAKLFEKSLSLDANGLKLWTENKSVFDWLAAHPRR